MVKVRSAKRKLYDLQELAHYGLFPLRYRLELLHPEARMYRSEWQLEIYAQGVWINHIYGLLSESDEITSKKDSSTFYSQLLRFLESSRVTMRNIVPAFSPVTWHAIEIQVKSKLKNFSDERYRYFLKIVQGNKESFRVMVDGSFEEQTIKINIDVPYMAKTTGFDAAILSDIQTVEWLLPGESENKKNGREAIEQEIEMDGVRLFPTQYQAVTWWRNTINAYFVVEKKQKVTDNPYTRMLEEHYIRMPDKIAHWVQSIEQNKFPKHAGEHCTSCPVRLECLGIAGEEGEVTA
ncbi:hypothetical protein ACFU8X_28300 [Brevibacillus porteri]|uniref:hypothetical protein n=1 Tax=Brevibacillus porteri TaxID=2126350 RepID=UPI00370BFAB4